MSLSCSQTETKMLHTGRLLFKDQTCCFSISLLASSFLPLSLSLLLFTREGIGARAACHPFYAGDELMSQRAGYDGRIDCFIADYVSYAFCPVILPKWSPGIAILGDIPCVQLRVAERTRVPRVAHDRMEIEQR